MEWLLLIVISALVIVPVVLFYGFAGCASFTEAPADPATQQPTTLPAPVDLVATAISTSQINLTWNHASGGGVTFIVSLLGPENSWNENFKTVTTGFATECTSLTEGATYSFRVRAVSGSTESARSDIAKTRTFKWETAYNNVLTDQAGVLAGVTLAQRIDKSLLVFSGVGRRVRLTLRATAAAAGAPLLLTEVSLSHVAELNDEPLNPNPNPYDSRSPLEKFGAVSVPGDGSPLVLPEKDFFVNRMRDLLVAFDVSASNATNARRTSTNVGASVAYRRDAAQQAGVGDRSGMYTPTAGTVFLVEKVEVLTSES